MNNKFYKKDWLMWLMFAICIPIGIALMWINNRYKKAVRIITSILYLFLFWIECDVIRDYQNSFSIIIAYIVMFVLLPYIIVHWKQIPDKSNYYDNVNEIPNYNNQGNEVYPHFIKKKNFFQRHRVFTFALAAVLFIAGLSMLGNAKKNSTTTTSQNQSSVTSQSNTTENQSSNATSSVQPAKEKTWVDVTKFEGNGIKNTEKFAIDSDEWRIVWSTQVGDAGKQNFQIYVNDKDGELVDLVANIIGQGNDISYMNKSGEYSLKIVSGQPYTITIQEKK